MRRGLLSATVVLSLLAGRVGPAVASASTAGEEAEVLGDLSLEQLLDLPVITATRGVQKFAEAPATVLVFDRRDIAERGYRDLSELLEDLPGVQVVRPRGATWFKAYWRGSRNNIGSPWLLLRDGLVLNHLYFNTADVISALPLSDVARVEVVFGPASSLYGANAFMGVVHVLTEDGVGDRAARTRLRAEVGEDGAEVLDATWSRAWKAWNTTVTLRAENGDPRIADPDVATADPALVTDPRLWGDVARDRDWGGEASSPHRHRAAEVRLFRRLPGNGGELELGGSFFRTSTGYGVEYAWDRAQPLAVWSRSDVSWHSRWNVDAGDRVRSSTLLRYRTSSVDDDSRFAQAFEGEDGERLVDLSVWEASNESWTLAQDLEILCREDLRLWTGVEVEYRNLQKAYETAFGPAVRPEDLDLATYPAPRPGQQTGPPENRESTWDVGTYVQGRWTALPGRWFHVGVRWDDHSEYGDDVTFRAGHVGREGAWTWKMLVGEAFQEPNPRLLYGGWSGSGSDPDLRPERSRTFEASLARTTPGLETSLGLWWVENEDTIVSTGERIVEGPDGPEVVPAGARNLGDRRVRGVDLRLRLRPTAGLDLEAVWSHLFDAEEATFDEVGVRHGMASVGDLADDRVVVTGTWRRRTWSVHSALRWTADRRTVASNPVETVGASTTVDLRVRRRVATGLSIGLRVTNLFDEDVLHPGVRDASSGREPGVFDEDGRWRGSDGFFSSVLPQPGRSIGLTLELDL